MKKSIYIILLVLLFPLIVNATNLNSDTYYGKNLNVCTSSKYQDSSISINNDIYFSHCMESNCYNGSASLHYYSDNHVTCSNGNTTPYVEIINNDSCKKITQKSCSEIEYCSMILYYDCNRVSKDKSYVTTTATTTKKTTKKITTKVTTTQTTTVKESDTRLESLTLSNGYISFNKDVYEYEIDLVNGINSIDITAIPIDSSCTIKIDGNSNITNGSIIKITVTGNNGKESIYSIKVKINEEVKKSSNSKLKTLGIRNHDITFNSAITNYTVIVETNETELDIYELVAEDSEATIKVNGNTNITNGSKVEIVVTAPDEKNVSIYTIDIKVKKESNFIKVLFIIIIILAIIALAYYIYKKFVISKSGDKYEYE